MFEIFRLAFNELYSNKGRTILTAMGISIGVMAVSLILSSGQLAQGYLNNTISSTTGDAKTIQINAFQPGNRDATTTITSDDYNFVLANSGGLPYENVVPIYTYSVRDITPAQVSYRQDVIGSTTNYIPLIKSSLDNLDGRFFDQKEQDIGANVAVVSRDYARNRLGKASLLGKNIILNKASFLVIGEYDEKSSLGSGSETVYAPLKAVWAISGTTNEPLSTIRFTAKTQDQVDFVNTQLSKQLNAYRAGKYTGLQARATTFTTSQSTLDTVNGVLNAFQVFLSLVAVISLVVGGIGVLNVMLMAVAQRIKEIGIRKAFGAKNKDILLLFLSESITLTALSGLFGALFAQYLTFLGVQIVTHVSPDTVLTYSYSWTSIYVAFLLSATIGVAFGIYPAYKAGKLSVVDALRYD
jgi:putative ABC transport system permease protein